jgi:hypothetical protein
MTNRLVVSRDVIFEESKPWDRENFTDNSGFQLTETSIVDHQLPIQATTTVEDSEGSVPVNQDSEGELSCSKFTSKSGVKYMYRLGISS